MDRAWMVSCAFLILAPAVAGCLAELGEREPTPVWLMTGRSCEARSWQVGVLPSNPGPYERDVNVSNALSTFLDPAMDEAGAYRARLGGGAVCGQWDGWIFYAYGDRSPGSNWSRGGEAWLRSHDGCVAPDWMVRSGLEDEWGNRTERVSERAGFSLGLAEHLQQQGHDVRSAYVYLFPPRLCTNDALLDVTFMMVRPGDDWLPVVRHLAHPVGT